jgi:thiol-disulfide isomerase/thioredoxin
MSTILHRILYTALVISFGCNIFCGYDYYKMIQNEKLTKLFIKNFNIKDVSTLDGSNFLLEKIRTSGDKSLKNKKYYFISIWNTMCKPCIKEMPMLDTLAMTINREDLGYIYLTENGDKMINEFRKNHTINSRNFSFINDADNYISSILKSHNLKNRQYPIQIIIDSVGNIKHFQIGTIESSKDTVILNCVKKLN